MITIISISDLHHESTLVDHLLLSFEDNKTSQWLKKAEYRGNARLPDSDLGMNRKLNGFKFSELASNDGNLLQYFAEKKIPALGIDPAANVAAYSINKRDIRTETKFFGLDTARQIVEKYGKADLLIGHNVLAHVPDIYDFVLGMKASLNTAIHLRK